MEVEVNSISTIIIIIIVMIIDFNIISNNCYYSYFMITIVTAITIFMVITYINLAMILKSKIKLINFFINLEINYFIIITSVIIK